MAYSYWMSFVGNVLGAPGQMAGWVYEGAFTGSKPSIWMLEWDGLKPYPTDAQVAATTLRHGNFDYVTNTVMGSLHHQPQAAELALSDPEAGLLRRRERLHLAMGGPDGRDQALCAAGQGAL
jgi:hypothetical protein